MKTGIDWKAAVAGGEKEWKDATDKAHSYLNGLKGKLSHDELKRATQMGILNADGKNSVIKNRFILNLKFSCIKMGSLII